MNLPIRSIAVITAAIPTPPGFMLDTAHAAETLGNGRLTLTVDQGR